jgi:cobalt-zinc-cadmium efflux system protein
MHIEHDHSHEHNHHKAGKGAEKSLIFSFIISLIIFSVELYGSFLSGSLSLLSDAGHIGSDLGGFIISYIALRLASKPQNEKMHFGHGRAEILGAFLNAVLLLLISLFIVKESIERIIEPIPIKGIQVIITGCIACIGNLIGIFLLRSHSKHNLNLHSAYLHILSDLIGSLGVVLGGIIINYTGWMYIDSIISLAISYLILRFAWRLLKKSSHILLEASPQGIDMTKVKSLILSCKGVQSISDIKAWSISSKSHAIYCSIITDARFDENYLRHELSSRYNFENIFITIQK